MKLRALSMALPLLVGLLMFAVLADARTGPGLAEGFGKNESSYFILFNGQPTLSATFDTTSDTQDTEILSGAYLLLDITSLGAGDGVRLRIDAVLANGTDTSIRCFFDNAAGSIFQALATGQYLFFIGDDDDRDGGGEVDGVCVFPPGRQWKLFVDMTGPTTTGTMTVEIMPLAGNPRSHNR